MCRPLGTNVSIILEQLKPYLPDYPSLQAKEKESRKKQKIWQMTPGAKLGATVTWRPCVGYGPPLWWNVGRADCSEVLPSLNSIWTTVLKLPPSHSFKYRTTKHWSTWGRYNTNTETEQGVDEFQCRHITWIQLGRSEKTEQTFPKAEM